MGDYNQSLITALQARTIGMASYGTPLGPALPEQAGTNTSTGGSATQNDRFVQLSTDATVGENASVFITGIPYSVQTGLIVGWFHWQVNQAQGSLAEDIYVGFANRMDPSGNDRAVFRPDVGDNTDGNIEVDNGGTTTTGTLDYPPVNDVLPYAIAIDNDRGETRFYYNNANPLQPGAASATISATPGSVRTPMIGILSAQTDAAEAIDGWYLRWLYVP